MKHRLPCGCRVEFGERGSSKGLCSGQGVARVEGRSMKRALLCCSWQADGSGASPALFSQVLRPVPRSVPATTKWLLMIVTGAYLAGGPKPFHLPRRAERDALPGQRSRRGGPRRSPRGAGRCGALRALALHDIVTQVRAFLSLTADEQPGKAYLELDALASRFAVAPRRCSPWRYTAADYRTALCRLAIGSPLTQDAGRRPVGPRPGGRVGELRCGGWRGKRSWATAVRLRTRIGHWPEIGRPAVTSRIRSVPDRLPSSS